MLKRKAQISTVTAMHRLAKAGLSLTHIAQHLSDFGTAPQKVIGLSCLSSMEEGKGFSAGLKGHIDNLAFESIAAGEYAGRVQDGLNNALETLKMQMSSGAGLLFALLKPLAALVLLLYFVAFLGTTGIPALLEMIPKNQRNGSSMLLMLRDAGLIVNTFLLPVLAGLVVAIAGAIASLPYFRGSYREVFDSLPIYSDYRLVQAGNFLGALGNMTRSGIKLRDSLEQLETTATPYMSWHIEAMLHSLQYERNLGVILDTGLLNAPEVSAISLLGEIGDHSVTLQRSADMHRDILRAKTEFVREYGASLIKVFAYITGFIIAGSIVSFIFTLVII